MGLLFEDLFLVALVPSWGYLALPTSLHALACSKQPVVYS